MYNLLMGDVPQLQAALSELNQNNCTIVSSFYISDSQQFVIIYDEPVQRQKIGFLTPDEE